MKLWIKIIKEEKLLCNVLESDASPLSRENYEKLLPTACRRNDLPFPVTLLTHYNYLHDFNMVKYYPRDFIDPVDFDLFTVENVF